MKPGRLEGAAEVLVVGGGIVGTCTALALARRGVDVIVMERDAVNAHASGTNAGSLHVQINSHFAKLTSPAIVRGVDAAAPLHVAAVDAWRRLAASLETDVELSVAGGLMLAENDEQLSFLERVVARQVRLGIPSEIVTGDRLQGLAPYLSKAIVGASFCPIEGKVNPTLATPAIARAAMQAGARLHAGTTLLGLESSGEGFNARTSHGDIRCGQVVNAAGAWAAKVAAMVGLDLPVDARPLHMNVTEPTDYFLPYLVQHAGVRLTMKQAARGNLIIGGGWPSEPPDEAGRLGVLRPSVEGNLWVAQQAVPRLADLYLLRSWGSLIYRVPDICPVLGPSRRHPRLHTAVAVPNGYTLGPLCAEIVASLVGGASHPLYHEGLGPDRYLQDQNADRPPSAAIVAPLIMRDSSEARNSAMLATSRGAPTENG